MNVSETMRRIEFLLEKHAPRDSLLYDMSDAIRSMPRTHGRRRELTQSQKNEILRLRAAGYTYNAIARAINSTDTVVWRTIKGISRGAKVLDRWGSQGATETAGLCQTNGRKIRCAHV